MKLSLIIGFLVSPYGIPMIGVVVISFLGFKIYNLSDTDEFVKKGERFGQILVHKKIPFEFEILDSKSFETYEKSQLRGSKGFGSSGI